MAGFATIGEVVDAELNGKARFYRYRKTPSQATTAGLWFDLSMSPGMPTPKYWFDAAPLTARAITQSSDGGAFHGANVSPSEKFLRKISAFGNTTNTTVVTPLTLLLCDYILYYPSVDDGTTDEQVMDNTVTLPRYTDGEGVQMLAVTTGARTGGQTFTVKYTNSKGETGKITPIVTQNTATALGTVTTNANTTNNGAGPFIPLASGDTGVRAIESVTMNGVDVGLFSLILVKPIAQVTLQEIIISTAGSIGTPTEKDLLLFDNNIPRIYDDAFLNFLVLPQNSLAATQLNVELKVVWT